MYTRYAALRLVDLVRSSATLMRGLRVARAVNPPDWLIGGRIVRASPDGGAHRARPDVIAEQPGGSNPRWDLRTAAPFAPTSRRVSGGSRPMRTPFFRGNRLLSRCAYGQRRGYRCPNDSEYPASALRAAVDPQSQSPHPPDQSISYGPSVRRHE